MGPARDGMFMGDPGRLDWKELTVKDCHLCCVALCYLEAPQARAQMQTWQEMVVKATTVSATGTE